MLKNYWFYSLIKQQVCNVGILLILVTDKSSVFILEFYLFY